MRCDIQLINILRTSGNAVQFFAVCLFVFFTWAYIIGSALASYKFFRSDLLTVRTHELFIGVAADYRELAPRLNFLACFQAAVGVHEIQRGGWENWDEWQREGEGEGISYFPLPSRILPVQLWAQPLPQPLPVHYPIAHAELEHEIVRWTS